MSCIWLINSCVLLISEFRYYQRNYEPLQYHLSLSTTYIDLMLPSGAPRILAWFMPITCRPGTAFSIWSLAIGLHRATRTYCSWGASRHLLLPSLPNESHVEHPPGYHQGCHHPGRRSSVQILASLPLDEWLDRTAGAQEVSLLYPLRGLSNLVSAEEGRGLCISPIVLKKIEVIRPWLYHTYFRIETQSVLHVYISCWHSLISLFQPLEYRQLFPLRRINVGLVPACVFWA